MSALVLYVVTIFLQNSMAHAAQGPQPSTAELSHRLEDERNTIDVFKQSSPMVVSVDSTRLSSDFFTWEIQEVPTGSGTGFVWDEKGHIITNFHVVQGALANNSQISITTYDGQRLKAKIVGIEPTKDIAVLKAEKSFIKYGFSKKISDSKNLLVGQKVLAIGSPFGFDQTLTSGIISALDRSMPSVLPQITIRNMVQTDASINPGNSGGPLLDSQGLLVGMNTAIISSSGSSAGIGFAVPAHTIASIAQQLIQYGKVIRPGLGISPLENHQRRILERYGYTLPEGVVIKTVHPGTPAFKKGLKGLDYHPQQGVVLGDIITHIDGKKIVEFDDLYNFLGDKKVGDWIELTTQRQGRSQKIKIQLVRME